MLGVYHVEMALEQRSNGLPKGSGLYWKGNVIYVAIRHNSIKHVHCCGTSDVEEALAFKRQKFAELISHDVVVKDRSVRLNELLDDYITHLERREADGGEYTSRKHEKSSYKSGSRINANLRPAFGDLRPKDLTTDTLHEYKAKRLQMGASLVTVNSEFRLLRAALRRGVKHTPRKVNPSHIPVEWPINDKAESKAARTGTITDAQYDLIMGELAEHLKPVFAFAIFSGARAKEIKFIRREEVDFERKVVSLRVGETKNGESRLLPLNDHVAALLLGWEARTQEQHPTCPWLFHLNGKQLGTWRTAWDAALRRAGLRVPYEINGKKKWKNLVTFHDTRRTMVTSLETLHERHVQKVSGHKTPSMVSRYDQSEAVEMVRKVQNEELERRAGKSDVQSRPLTATPYSEPQWKLDLRELKSSFEEGLITEAEYDAERAKVLANR